MERRPPPPGLDPVQLVRERRLGLPNDQTPSPTSSPARRPPVVMGFGAAMEQYLTDERAIRREQEIANAVDAALRRAEEYEAAVNAVDAVDFARRLEEYEAIADAVDVARRLEENDNHDDPNREPFMFMTGTPMVADPVEIGQILGLIDHLGHYRETAQEVHANTQLVHQQRIVSQGITPSESESDYSDSEEENDHEYLRDNPVEINTDITQQARATRSPIVSSDEGDWYFEQDGQPVGLPMLLPTLQTSPVQANTYLLTPTNPGIIMGHPNIGNNTPIIITPNGDGVSNTNEELTANLVTNSNVTLNTNSAMNRTSSAMNRTAIPHIPMPGVIPGVRAGTMNRIPITTNAPGTVTPVFVSTQQVIPPVPVNAQRTIPRAPVIIPTVPANNQRTIPINNQRTIPPIPTVVQGPTAERPTIPTYPVETTPNIPMVAPRAQSFTIADPRRPNPIVSPAVVLIRPPPTQNLYLKLPHPILDAIANDRDIALTGDYTEKAMQLFELDNIMPDWIQSIMTKTIGNFQALVGAKLYVFGALNGVNFIGVPGLRSKELLHYIRVSILLANPEHPETRFLPTILRECSRELIDLFSVRFNISREELRFIGRDDLEIAILTGRRDHIQTERIAAYATRFRLLYNHKHRDLLADLYQINAGDEASWVSLVRFDAHPMEHMIINLDQFKLDDIVDQLKIAVPLSFANNVAAYVRSNIVSYSEVLTRANIDVIPIERLMVMRPSDVETYFSKLTDQEIHSSIGAYVPYNRRVELVQNTIALINTPSFFYPTVRSYQRARNRETINLTDITDLNVFMIAYGTMAKYDVYELDDIIGAFTRDTETGLLSFRHPENQHIKFTVQEVEGLRQLLSCFPSTPGITRIIELIDQGLIDAHEKLAQDEEYMTRLQRFPVLTKQLIQQFLRQVFYIGMYMRRWQGPGHAFPLKQADTKLNIPELELDASVKKQIEPAVALLDQMGKEALEYCLNFRQCEYNQGGTIDVITEKFDAIWHRVGIGKQCIRMASSIFVGTGYHYLRVLFRETIPNINVKELAKIV